MKLVKKEFNSFEEANYFVEGLSKAINTTYLPSGSTIEEVYASFLKIQLNRTFNFNCGLGMASLEMTFNEEAMTFFYTSTSETSVFLQYAFDNEMKFKGGIIECDIPSGRVATGRCHYEAITQFIYGYNWKDEVVPQELVAINEESLGVLYPTPNWVLENLANRQAKDKPEERDAQLLALGYYPIANPIGFKKGWYSFPEAFYKHIVLSNSNNYFLLKEEDCVENTQAVSYKRLLEILAKESRRSRRAQAAEVEDYDYDESDYTEVDYQEGDE